MLDWFSPLGSRLTSRVFTKSASLLFLFSVAWVKHTVMCSCRSFGLPAHNASLQAKVVLQ